MSADLRMMSPERYVLWFKAEVQAILTRYLHHDINRLGFTAAHMSLASVNEAYIRSRIKLYGDGYLPNPPF